MPKETIWHPEAHSSDDDRRIDVTWGTEHPGVFINNVPADRSAVNRLIHVLRTARDKAYGRDE